MTNFELDGDELRRLAILSEQRDHDAAREKRDRIWHLSVSVGVAAIAATVAIVGFGITTKSAADTAARTSRAATYASFQSDMVRLQAADTQLVADAFAKPKDQAAIAADIQQTDTLLVDLASDAAGVQIVGTPSAQDRAVQDLARFRSLTSTIQDAANGHRPQVTRKMLATSGIACIPYSLLNNFAEPVRLDLNEPVVVGAVPSYCDNVYGGKDRATYLPQVVG